MVLTILCRIQAGDLILRQGRNVPADAGRSRYEYPPDKKTSDGPV